MAKKKARHKRKRRRRNEPFFWNSGIKPADDQSSVDIRVDTTTGEVTMVALPPGSHDTHVYYIQQHALLPRKVEAWSVPKLQRKVEKLLRSGAQADWEQALMILAHHQSERAVEVLVELKSELPKELELFWEMAYGEALGWLGYDYYADQSQPQIVAAGTSPEQAPN